MPRFFFHLCDGGGFTRDEEGRELADAPAARSAAIEGIRSIVAEDARGGSIDLSGHIAISDEAGDGLAVVQFSEAFDLKLQG